jgi:hypothetical protein
MFDELVAGSWRWMLCPKFSIALMLLNIRTEIFAAFDLLFSEENVFPPSEAGKTSVYSFCLRLSN